MTDASGRATGASALTSGRATGASALTSGRVTERCGGAAWPAAAPPGSALPRRATGATVVVTALASCRTTGASALTSGRVSGATCGDRVASCRTTGAVMTLADPSVRATGSSVGTLDFSVGAVSFVACATGPTVLIVCCTPDTVSLIVCVPHRDRLRELAA